MFGNNRQLAKCTTVDITIGEDLIQRAEVIKLLWIKLDKILTLIGHITEKCRKVTINLHKIGKVKNSLDNENKKNLIYALDTLHTDYCSSL